MDARGLGPNVQTVRLAGGWWRVQICSERKVLMTGLFRKKSTAGWWLISQTNRAVNVTDSESTYRMYASYIH
jgi:uncharacterized membrane protein